MTNETTDFFLTNLPGEVISALSLSLVILLIISMCKYHIAHLSTKQHWDEFFLELPIDVCSIVITVIITYTSKHDFVNVSTMTLAIVFTALLCSYFRRKAIINMDCGKKVLHFIYFSLDIVVCIVFIYCTLKYWF